MLTPQYPSSLPCPSTIMTSNAQSSRDHRTTVDMNALEWAKDKILMGSERKSAYINPKDRNCTAYHEAGWWATAGRPAVICVVCCSVRACI